MEKLVFRILPDLNFKKFSNSIDIAIIYILFIVWKEIESYCTVYLHLLEPIHRRTEGHKFKDRIEKFP